jgi:hypothetical protein
MMPAGHQDARCKSILADPMIHTFNRNPEQRDRQMSLIPWLLELLKNLLAQKPQWCNAGMCQRKGGGGKTR